MDLTLTGGVLRLAQGMPTMFLEDLESAVHVVLAAEFRGETECILAGPVEKMRECGKDAVQDHRVHPKRHPTGTMAPTGVVAQYHGCEHLAYIVAHCYDTLKKS